MRPIPEIKAVDVAFGEVGHLPKWEEIPDEFKRHSGRWQKIVSQWFFNGLPKETEFVPKEGVDPEKAINAIRAILTSFAPKHQHKEAGVAYLLSEWFDDIRVPTRTMK